jgi:hypothetical protein
MLVLLLTEIPEEETRKWVYSPVLEMTHGLVLPTEKFLENALL